jgi:group I intron endonuclease
MIIYIYKIENKLNGKKYIGQTINLEKRIKNHLSFSKTENKSYLNNKLYLELKNYSFNNFKWEIIDKVSTQEEANKKEIYWINYFDSINTGLNTRKGGKNFNIIKPKGSIKYFFLTILIPERQKEYLQSRKHETGLNMSDYLRRLVDKDIEANDKDQLARAI